ncbi:hypothetical protein vseg_020519 [Gypsophila vaccaria]
MAATLTFSTIFTPSSSSSSSSSTSLHSPHFHSFTHFPTKPLTSTPHILLLPRSRSFSPAVFGVGSGSHDSHDNDKDNDNVQVSVSYDEGRVYVGNLPYTMTSSHLSEIFSRSGHIKSVEIIYDKMTERSRGFGFVTMETIDEAREVIRMFDGTEVGGRTIRVNFPEVPKGGERKIMGPKIRINNQNFVDTPHKVYAGNLGWGVTSQGLKDAFADQPEFVSAKVIYERESGRSRGFGFVSFQSAEAAQSAITSMNGVELEGRPLRLNVAADRTRANTEIAT